MDKYNMKECNKCNKNLPKDNNHFYRRKKSKDGWDYKCKMCWGKKGYGVTQINATYKAKPGYKFCSTCKEEKIFSEFNKTRAIKDGYSVQCRVCSKKRNKEYNSRPEVKIKREQRFKEWRRMFYATAEGRAMNQKHLNLRRSRKANAIYNYTESIWEETLTHFNYECSYCGDTEKPLHQEHVIPLSKGGYYTRQNIIPACQYCNSSKHDKDLDDWYPNFVYYSKERHDKVKKWIGVKDNNQQLALF